MFVCAHGDVTAYCAMYDMQICDTWNGKITEYNGVCRVIVTDADITEAEYYFLKGEMLGRGYELVSTRYTDHAVMGRYLTYAKKRSNGRKSAIDAAIVQKIRELRAEGLTIRAIREAEGVCPPNGRKLSLSTIQKIINNKGEK